MQRIVVTVVMMVFCAGCVHSGGASRFIVGSVPDYRTTSTASAREHLAFVPAARTGDRGGAALPTEQRALTVESADPVLAHALAMTAQNPTALNHRRVGQAYLRAGISDLAADYFTAAIALNPSDAAAYDLRARVWRDWGFPELGLADAHRAVYFGPDSSAAQNTLATMLHRLGHRGEARARYERALVLDPSADYTHNNLCALALDEGDPGSALDACRRALGLTPNMPAARQNLERAEAMLARREGAGQHD